MRRPRGAAAAAERPLLPFHPPVSNGFDQTWHFRPQIPNYLPTML